jgi:tripeptidyl-peptidase-2
VDRRFIAVPEGATWAELRIKSTKHQVPGASVRCWVHTVQLEPQQRLPDAEHAYVLALNEGEPITKKMQVKGGMTMELCLAQFFTNAGAFTLEADVEFHGITVSRIVAGRDELTIVGGDGIAKLECLSSLRIETLKPTITFDQRRSFARPQTSSLRPLPSARDVHPNGRQMNELVLTYPLDLKEEKNNVTLSLPLSNHLYDSAVPMLLQVFDIQKKRRYFGDVYPKAIESLEKGSYTVQVQLLNDQVSVLEKLKNMTLRIDQKLSKPVEKVDLYEDHMDQFGSKAAGFEAVKLFPGERKILCMDTNLEGDALPKEAVPGDLLLGTISFTGPNDKQKLRYLVPPAVKKPSSDEDGGKKSEESVAELLTGLVKKVPEKEKNDFLARLMRDYPNDLGVLVSKLESISIEDKTKVKEIVEASEAVLSHKDVNEDQILIFLGSKRKPSMEASAEEKEDNKRLEKAKAALILALNRKARALLLREEGKSSDEFESTFERYRRVVDTSDKSFANVYITWSVLHNRLGTALQTARKLIKDVGAGTPETLKEKKQGQALERELLQKLDWKLWSAVNERHRVLDEPSSYEGF